jgi:hypothetical protein
LISQDTCRWYAICIYDIERNAEKESVMRRAYSREQKRELVSILLFSEHYLELDLSERNKLLYSLLDVFFKGVDDSGQKTGRKVSQLAATGAEPLADQ